MSSFVRPSNKEVQYDEQGEIEQIISELPKARSRLLCGFTKYQNFWFQTYLLPNIIKFQRNFIAQDQDIILASKPKCGTTWLKALLFSIVNRAHYTPSNTPLLGSNPHELVHSLEVTTVYSGPNGPDPAQFHSPRLLATHVPYALFPESIESSDCKIIYICRNPLDLLVSYWHFSAGQDENTGVDPTWTFEDCVDCFCRGVDTFGPFWAHVLGFWNESIERPNKVLFLKYEDLREDTEVSVKKIAEFVGFPFSKEEVRSGVVRDICDLCSLSSLKDIQVKNKIVDCVPKIKNETFFRKGLVGDWVNELSPETVERVEKVVREKLEGSGLVFKMSS